MAADRKQAERTASPWPTAIRFCVTFLLLTGFYAAVFSTPFVDRVLHEPMSRLVAASSMPLLHLFGEPQRAGTYLIFNGFQAEILDACNGVLPTFLFLAAVLALPSSWRAKLWGAAIGVPAIFVINVVRVVSLMILGALRPDIVERVHIHVWQTLVVILAMGLWVFWAERFVRPQLAVRR